MFHEQLRKLRKAHHMSQPELAEKIGVSKQSISNWENDNILPSIEMLVTIARTFHVSTDYLLGMDDWGNSRQYVDVTGLSPEAAAHVQQIVDDLKYHR